MMASYDQRARATAARMLATKSAGGKGQTVTIALTTTGAYSTSTGAMAAGSTTSQTCSGVEDYYRAGQIDGALIKVGDVKFLLSPLTTSGEAVTVGVAGAVVTYAGGEKWSVIAAEPVSPAGTLVYTMLHLRRS